MYILVIRCIHTENQANKTIWFFLRKGKFWLPYKCYPKYIHKIFITCQYCTNKIFVHKKKELKSFILEKCYIYAPPTGYSVQHHFGTRELICLKQRRQKSFNYKDK